MFILKRQDVDIKNFQHPKKDQPIPILHYQGQTFRLLSVFNAAQEEDARALWRDLTDNRGKACVLLEEPERFSVWGKVRLEALGDEGDAGQAAGDAAAQFLIQGCLLLLQALSIDIEDLLGNKQAELFEKDIAQALTKANFPQMNSDKAVKAVLTMDPLATQVPAWGETHLQQLLTETHRLGKNYFGNTTFTDRSLEALEDLPSGERTQFVSWLAQSTAGKLWK
ncbi:MAG: Npun_F0813 family protein [Cyanobacteria bacterium P01_H01_bin.58]